MAPIATFYERHPELRRPSTRGWFAYQRLSWFYADRQSSSDPGSQLARWNAYLDQRRRELGRSPAVSPPWYSLGPENIPGRIQAIAFDPTDPQVIYVGAAGGGPWKSRDGGLTWQPLGDMLPSLAVGAIAVDPRQPDIVLLGTGDPTVAYDHIYGVGILRSTDGGASWAPTNVVRDPYTVRAGFNAIDINPTTGVALAGSVDGLLRSTDSGATWSTIDSLANWTDVKWRPGSSDTAYAAKEYGGLYRSIDGGRSFAHLAGGLPADSSMAGLLKLAVSSGGPSYVYAGLPAASSLGLLGIYRSTDGGDTWSLRSDQPNIYGDQGWYGNTLVADPTNPERLFAGGVLLYRSDDGGATWTDLGPAAFYDYHGAGYRPGVGDLWEVTDGGVYTSPDKGSTWVSRSAGLVTLQIYGMCYPRSSRTLAYGGSQDHGILLYHGNPTWPLGPGGDAMLCNCDPQDPLHVYIEREEGLHRVSTDGLLSSTLTIRGLYGQSRWVAPVDMDLNNPQCLFTATSAGIFRTNDGGDLWQWVGDGNDIFSVAVSPVVGRWVWALERSSGVVRRSSDGGTTWTSFQAAPFSGIAGTKILADPSDTLGAFCTFLHHPLQPPVVLRTKDGGVSWEDVSGDLEGQSVNTIAVDPDRPIDWYVGTELGVWYSGDGGAHWQPYGTGLPYTVVLDLGIQAISGKLRAATHGRGLWEAAVPRSGVARSSGFGPLLLELVSPNPAKTLLTVRFSGKGGSRMDLRVFDVAGRLVAPLARAPADGVVRTARWETGTISPGVYFVELRSGTGRASQKVVVVR